MWVKKFEHPQESQKYQRDKIKTALIGYYWSLEFSTTPLIPPLYFKKVDYYDGIRNIYSFKKLPAKFVLKVSLRFINQSKPMQLQRYN